MAWHTTADYQDIAADNRSVAVAVANLFEKLDVPYDQEQLREAPFRATDGRLHVTDTGDSGWPQTNNALVKLRRIDESVGGVVDHWCLVADPVAHSVIDSTDGYIRSAAQYGEPLAWVSFEKATPAPEPAEPEVDDDTEPPKPGMTYIWVKYDNIWEVARRLNFRPLELLEHNGIDDPRTIRPGAVLHLPEPRLAASDPEPRIEVLDKPRVMHVVAPGGTRKWLFGRARTRAEVGPTGPRVREGEPVTILAIAYVPLAGDQLTLTFYIDPVAFGDYATTGRLRYTIGFDPEDLADGIAEKKPELPAKTPPRMAATMEQISERLDILNRPPEETPAAAVVPHPLLRPARVVNDVAPHISTSASKATLHPLYDDRRIVRFVAMEALDVHELDERRNPVHVDKYGLIDAQLGFYIDNDEYVLPLDHRDTGLWYYIRRDQLTPEAELYNPDLNPEELTPEIIRHRLTPVQRYWWVPLAMVLSWYQRFAGRGQRRESIK